LAGKRSRDLKTGRPTYIIFLEVWVKMLDDEVISTALLDRLLYHCEVINLSEKSYRMKNRKTIFNNQI